MEPVSYEVNVICQFIMNQGHMKPVLYGPNVIWSQNTIVANVVESTYMNIMKLMHYGTNASGRPYEPNTTQRQHTMKAVY